MPSGGELVISSSPCDVIKEAWAGVTGASYQMIIFTLRWDSTRSWICHTVQGELTLFGADIALVLASFLMDKLQSSPTKLLKKSFAIQV